MMSQACFYLIVIMRLPGSTESTSSNVNVLSPDL